MPEACKHEPTDAVKWIQNEVLDAAKCMHRKVTEGVNSMQRVDGMHVRHNRLRLFAAMWVARCCSD